MLKRSINIFLYLSAHNEIHRTASFDVVLGELQNNNIISIHARIYFWISRVKGGY